MVTKNEIKDMIPNDLSPNSSISLNKASLKTRALCGLVKTCFSMKKYLPICSM